MPANFNLEQYIEEFRYSSIASFITNSRGSILEVNNASMQLMNTSDPIFLKNKLLVSFVHRKYVRSFHELMNSIEVDKPASSDKIWFRPRKTLPFQANIHAHIIMQARAIKLIRWQIENVLTQTEMDD